MYTLILNENGEIGDRVLLIGKGARELDMHVMKDEVELDGGMG